MNELAPGNPERDMDPIYGQEELEGIFAEINRQHTLSLKKLQLAKEEEERAKRTRFRGGIAEISSRVTTASVIPLMWWGMGEAVIGNNAGMAFGFGAAFVGYIAARGLFGYSERQV
ncbi:MAG: hypothetical protein UV41_C0034G0005 [Candidatus Daviesbacteria bacterium GW2011_GWA2_42_7]|uniref:Uncharacterized protein n=1 Tax=Candidatus Daviesbacteria bacterium GW2011_GWA2_42_7 TaxID=1618425 RepID=A0A0G1E6I2_9BACT|nr:MAG: hypothetical protein UV41_C0034G0005 [Candidatus Daviesbacteria bacterium GW2011_GWA2_42_7]OGE18928.1 MAG: hypothetical protein A2874_03780 [Candidatus Daviesbacteria bacterium RIFCSPHIGHO2_01_FULL_43_17]